MRYNILQLHHRL